MKKKIFNKKNSAMILKTVSEKTEKLKFLTNTQLEKIKFMMKILPH